MMSAPSQLVLSLLRGAKYQVMWQRASKQSDAVADCDERDRLMKTGNKERDHAGKGEKLSNSKAKLMGHGGSGTGTRWMMCKREV